MYELVHFNTCTFCVCICLQKPHFALKKDAFHEYLGFQETVDYIWKRRTHFCLKYVRNLMKRHDIFKSKLFLSSHLNLSLQILFEAEKHKRGALLLGKALKGFVLRVNTFSKFFQALIFRLWHQTAKNNENKWKSESCSLTGKNFNNFVHLIRTKKLWLIYKTNHSDQFERFHLSLRKSCEKLCGFVGEKYHQTLCQK